MLYRIRSLRLTCSELFVDARIVRLRGRVCVVVRQLFGREAEVAVSKATEIEARPRLCGSRALHRSLAAVTRSYSAPGTFD